MRFCGRQIQDRLHWQSCEKLDESDDAKDADDVTIILDDNEEDIRRKVDADDNDKVFVVKGRWERNATPPPSLPAMKAKPTTYCSIIIWW